MGGLIWEGLEWGGPDMVRGLYWGAWGCKERSNFSQVNP